MKKPKLFKQEMPYSCTIACLRMVLEQYGIQVDEKTLRIKSKTKLCGTHPFNVIECANSYGLKGFIDSLNVETLRKYVDQDIPVIVNILKVVDHDFYLHSVCVYRISRNFVYMLDPEDGETKIALDRFERLWENSDFTAIVICDTRHPVRI